MHDRQIAEQLADEGFVTGTGKRWSMIAVRNMRSHHAIPRTAPSVPTAKPLPDRRDDGLYSVLGAARHFGVTRDVVRLWIARGLVRCSGELGRAHGPLWLAIDEAAELHLRDLAEHSRRRPFSPLFADSCLDGAPQLERETPRSGVARERPRDGFGLLPWRLLSLAHPRCGARLLVEDRSGTA